MAQYEEISKRDFDLFMGALGFKEVEVEGTKEAVYQSPSINDEGCMIRIYSSVAYGEGRDVGKDAIRAVLVDSEGRIYFNGVKRVHRVKRWRNNLLDRIDSMYEAKKELFKFKKPVECKKCGDKLVMRSTGNLADSSFRFFMGCSTYPKCKHTEAV